jgi:hypothetical protein
VVNVFGIILIIIKIWNKKIEIGKIGKFVGFGTYEDDGVFKQYGQREVILYQCPTCKTIKLD